MQDFSTNFPYTLPRYAELVATLPNTISCPTLLFGRREFFLVLVHKFFVNIF